MQSSYSNKWLIVFQYDWFFSSWDVDDHVPVDEESAECMPVSGMNQELLNKAEILGKIHAQFQY